MATDVNKEAFVELQGRLLSTDKKLKQVATQLRIKETDRKAAILTLQELQDVPESTNTYKAIGRAFVLQPMDDLRKEYDTIAEDSSKAIEVLQGRKGHLEKQMKEVEESFKELIQQSPALVQQVARSAMV